MSHFWAQQHARLSSPGETVWRCINCHVFKVSPTQDGDAPMSRERGGPAFLPPVATCEQVIQIDWWLTMDSPANECAHCAGRRSRHVDGVKCLYGPGVFSLRYCAKCLCTHRTLRTGFASPCAHIAEYLVWP